MIDGGPKNESLQIDLESTIKVSAVHGNMAQEFIIINIDKLKLIIRNHADAIERKNSWIAPLGVFLTLVLSILTTDFKDWFLKANVWSAIFIIAAILSFGWLIRESIAAYKATSIEDLVKKIKNQSD